MEKTYITSNFDPLTSFKTIGSFPGSSEVWMILLILISTKITNIKFVMSSNYDNLMSYVKIRKKPHLNFLPDLEGSKFTLYNLV